MTKDLANKGPSINTSQKIGDDARSALHANKPQQWILGESPGDDFGYDFLVTAFGSDEAGAQCAFYIQLKGTTQENARIADGKFLSYSFNRTTLNLWHKSGFAVLVTIADLIDTRDPKVAKVYFHFANHDLDEILPNLQPDQKTVVLHVPTSQIVHRELDILPIVQPYLDDLNDARQLAKERRLATGTPASESASTISIQSSVSATPEIMSSGEEIEALIDTLAHKAVLKAALAAQRSGDYERVLRLISIPTLEEMNWSNQETAVSAYLHARAFEAIGDSDKEEAMINIASALLPNNDDIAALAAQKKFDSIDFGPQGHDARQLLLVSLQGNKGPSVTCLKAKILALNGNFDEARKLLEPFPVDKSLMTMAVISIVEHDWDRAIAEIESCRTLPTMRENQLLWLNALEAKSHLEAALAGASRPTEGNFVIPSTGLPGIDYSRLRLAYEASMKAMTAGQRLNWPANIQYVMDVLPISSMLLGHTEDALPLMAACAFARPTISSIREVVAKFAVQYGRPQIAVQLGDLAGNSARFENETAVMAVAAYKAGNITKSLSYVTDEFLADTSTTDVYLSSLMMLGTAANEALHNELLEKIRIRLDVDTSSRHYRAVLDTVVQVQKSLLRRRDAVKNLYEYWQAHDHPALVGYHLLDNSDPSDTEEAALIIEVATNIESMNSLGADHLAILSQALLTLNSVKVAIANLRIACERYDQEPRLNSLLGIALELDGQSPEAYKIIGQLLETGKASETARRYFIQIAARMGFFERAEEQVRAALAKTSSNKRRLQHLNTLFQLLLAAGNRQKDVEEIAWEYGKLSNQKNEREEGIFLQEYLMATLPQELAIRPDRIQDFRRRLDAYNEHFPKSKYLWRGNIPSEGPPEAILAALQEATGVTDKDIANGIEIERKMDRGALLVPFSWRPRRFLQNISDVFMLWQIRKQAPMNKAAFHFQCNVPGYDRHTPPNIVGAEAVISLTSLLLLDEIGLLVSVLDSFQRIVVARSTLITLQEARNAFLGGWGCDKATRIMRELQRKFEKISHPPYPTENQQRGIPDWHYEEKIAMQQAGRVYFCDDIIETALVCGFDNQETIKPSLATVDFLNWADQTAGLLSAQQVADALGRMIRLNVGFVVIQQRYFIAAIPAALQHATSLTAENEAIDSSETFCSILDGLWDSSKSFDEIQEHFAQNMSYLLNEGNANEAVLVALWLRWLQSVRLKVKPSLTVEWKLALGFTRTLVHLQHDKKIVQRLWKSFWTAIKRGLGAELYEPEDIVGIRLIANILGIALATDDNINGSQAGSLFDKAKLGLEQGTSLEAEFSRAYVDSAAKETIKQKTNPKK